MKLIVLFFLLSSLASVAQSVSGRVVDDSTDKPLSQASVFVSNTSIGTTTAADGSFTLNGVPAGSTELVVSYIGYETAVAQLSGKGPKTFLFRLHIRNSDLENVIVRSYEKNGWDHWGFLFRNNFIGTAAEAADCTIENTKDIGFIFSEQSQDLNAYAKKPIVIINKKLGYRIEFSLEQFTYNMKSRMLYFAGYPLFTPLKGGASRKKKWAAERRRVYNASFLLFTRAVYNNRLAEEGFVVRKLVRLPNAEKERIRKKLRSITDRSSLPADTQAYYFKVMAQSDFSDILYSQPLAYSSFATRTDSSTVVLQFDDYLHITHTATRLTAAERSLSGDSTPGSLLTSRITLQNDRRIAINSSGGFFPPSNIILMDYWGWSEKAGRMLPLDYVPE